MTNIRPLGKLLLVEEIKVTESKTASGLIMTADASEQELHKGIVIDIGPGEVSSFNGTLYPVDTIARGMVVYYSPNHATEVKDSADNKYFFVNSSMLFGYESK